MYKTVFWTLWERARVRWFGSMALKHVKYHIWNESPVQVRCMILDAWGWCTETVFQTSPWSEVAQSCPTLCDPIDWSLPGSSVHGIFQARILEWVAISFSNAWKWKVKVKSLNIIYETNHQSRFDAWYWMLGAGALSCARLLATSWTAAYQAPPSMGFSKQEYWSGLPLPSAFKEHTHK